MKNVLTIALAAGGTFDESLLFGGAEVIALDGETPFSGLKKAKGKYTILVCGEAKIEDLADFLTVADSANADILTFEGGCAFKTGILQRLTVKNYLPYSAEIAAVLSSKSVQRLEKKPFTFSKLPVDLSEEAIAFLAQSLSDYTASKGRVPVEVYGLARDLICAKLTEFYLSFMLAIFKRTQSYETLVDFDAKISTDDKVLYLVFENRFSQLFKLKSLRKRKFKINLFEMFKVKNLLK